MNRHTRSGIAGTKTEQNLINAARGEALAHTKYKLFSELAAESGQHEASRMFNDFAHNEKEHAELWLGYLNELDSTENNLNSAISGENFEATEFYPEAARIAAEEGFTELADKFRMAGDVESNHAKSYKAMVDDMTNGNISSGEANTEWMCSNCGFHTKGNMPPEHCPLCSYPGGYFRKYK